MLDVAIDDRRLASNPARHVRNLPRHGPGKRRVYLSHEQVATLAACSAHPTMVLTLAYTGLRWGEATGLRGAHVDREAHHLKVKEVLSEDKGRLFRKAAPMSARAHVTPI